MATDEEILARVGRRIAEVRTQRNLTQAQVAEGLNIAVQYLQVVEAGKQNLTLSTLNKLASFLDVELSELFTQPKTMVRQAGRPRKKQS